MTVALPAIYHVKYEVNWKSKVLRLHRLWYL